MYKTEMFTINEDTKESVQYSCCYEGQFICMGREKTKYDVVEAFNTNCNIVKKLVKNTKNNEDQLTFWKNNPELWKKHHQLAVKEGVKVEDLKLTYYIVTITLEQDNKIIRKEIFKYGV